MADKNVENLKAKNSQNSLELGSENKKSKEKPKSDIPLGQSVDMFKTTIYAHENPAFEEEDDFDLLREKAVDQLSNMDNKVNDPPKAYEKLELKIGDIELERPDDAEVKVVKPNGHRKQQNKISEPKMADLSLSVLSKARQAALREGKANVSSPIEVLNDENDSTSTRKRPPYDSSQKARSLDDIDGFLSNAKAVNAAYVFSRQSQSVKVPSSSRWHSLQEPSERKPLRRLFDLSFSDTGDTAIQDYGELKNADALPKWKLAFQKLRKLDGEGLLREKVVKLPEEIMPPLRKLMQELTERGKVKQIAIVNQDGTHLLATYPKWSMSEGGVNGVVKAVMGKQQMLKLFIDGEMYTCFKHSPDTMVARSLDHLVMVAKRTASTVVVALSLDDTPGSCVHEVSEFADVLLEKGW